MKKLQIVGKLQKQKECSETNQISVGITFNKGFSVYKSQIKKFANNHSLKKVEIKNKFFFVKIDGIKTYAYESGEVTFFSDHGSKESLWLSVNKILEMIVVGTSIQLVIEDSTLGSQE